MRTAASTRSTVHCTRRVAAATLATEGQTEASTTLTSSRTMAPGRTRFLDLMPRPFILIPLLVVVAGIVWMLIYPTLLPMVVVIGGVTALGINALPGVIDWFARGLSTGWRRR